MAALGSVDAQNCYDHIVHLYLSLCDHAMKFPTEIAICMLLAIQLMQFYLQTSYGNSSKCYGNMQDRVFQGLCQGTEQHLLDGLK